MRTVPTTATTMRKTPRIRVRVSPRPRSRTACHLPGILHPLLGRAETPSYAIVVMQRPVVRGDIRVQAVYLVQPIAPLPIDGSADSRHAHALRDLIPTLLSAH